MRRKPVVESVVVRLRLRRLVERSVAVVFADMERAIAVAPEQLGQARGILGEQACETVLSMGLEVLPGEYAGTAGQAEGVLSVRVREVDGPPGRG